MAERHPKEHHKRARRAKGGRADSRNEHTYNAEGSPAMKVAKETKADGFKRGGKVEGEKAKKRLDRKPRGESKMEAKRHEAEGGRKANIEEGHRKPRMAAGGSPYSAAHKDMDRKDNKGAGHEGEQPGRVV